MYIHVVKTHYDLIKMSGHSVLSNKHPSWSVVGWELCSFTLQKTLKILLKTGMDRVPGFLDRVGGWFVFFPEK